MNRAPDDSAEFTESTASDTDKPFFFLLLLSKKCFTLDPQKIDSRAKKFCCIVTAKVFGFRAETFWLEKKLVPELFF